MDITQLQLWIEQNQILALFVIIILSVIGFFVAQFIIARSLVCLAKRTDTQYDDIIVRHLRPFRVAWIAPVIVVYVFADLFPAYQTTIEYVALF
jgi:miniconductance mechanosensitive channel